MIPSHPTSTLIIDGDALARRGLAALVEKMNNHKVCGMTGDEKTARELCVRDHPQLIILSFPLNDGDTLTLLREFKELNPKTEVIVIVENDACHIVERVFAAGAIGVLDRDASPEEFARAVARAGSAGVYVSERLTENFWSHLAFKKGVSRDSDDAHLSDRELAVYLRLANGDAPSVIAKGLGISVKTVESHIERMKGKLHVPTTAALRQRAIRWGRQTRGLIKTRQPERRLLRGR